MQGFTEHQKAGAGEQVGWGKEELFENYITNLRRQLDVVNSDQARLEAERNHMQDVLEGFKNK